MRQFARQGKRFSTKFPPVKVSPAVFAGGEGGGRNVHHIVQVVSGRVRWSRSFKADRVREVGWRVTREQTANILIMTSFKLLSPLLLADRVGK